MVKLVIFEKQRRKPEAPSQRTLRRSSRPIRAKIGLRAVLFLILLSLVLGTIGISLNMTFERWEREHSARLHGK